MNRASSSINFVSKMFGSWNITIILFVDNRMGSENCQLNGLSSHFLTNTKRKGIPSHRIRVCFKVKGNLSCYQCRFKADGRTGDLMLGDFWGAVKEDPFRNRNGVSVIFVRTGKGRNLLRNTEGIRLFLSDFERAAVENSMVVHSRKERPEKENIRFWGWQENPYPYIAAADWFVSASEYETFGLSVHEAGALNVPSIVGTLPVFEECVDREKVLLVENGEEGIYQGMLYAVRQSRLSQGMKKRNDDKLHEEQYIKRLKAIEDLIIG